MTARPDCIRSQLAGLRLLTTVQILDALQEGAELRRDRRPIQLNAPELRRLDAVLVQVRGELADAMASRESRS